MDNLEKEIEELIEEFQNLEVYKQYIAIRNQEKTNLEFLKLKEDARIAKQEIRKYVSDSAKLKEQIDTKLVVKKTAKGSRIDWA